MSEESYLKRMIAEVRRIPGWIALHGVVGLLIVAGFTLSGGNSFHGILAGFLTLGAMEFGQSKSTIPGSIKEKGKQIAMLKNLLSPTVIVQWVLPMLVVTFLWLIFS